MKYAVFIGSDGLPVPEARAVMQRELPAWIEEMNGRGVRLLGRELDRPQTAVTVRVRGGETLVTDGLEIWPFAAGLRPAASRSWAARSRARTRPPRSASVTGRR